MENKKFNNNVFESIVLEPVSKAEASTVVVLHLVVLVVPVTDDDIKDSGLNQ